MKNQEITIGQTVSHKTYGGRLIVKRISESLLTCEEMDKGLISTRNGMATPVVVFKKENAII